MFFLCFSAENLPPFLVESYFFIIVSLSSFKANISRDFFNKSFDLKNLPPFGFARGAASFDRTLTDFFFLFCCLCCKEKKKSRIESIFTHFSKMPTTGEPVVTTPKSTKRTSCYRTLFPHLRAASISPSKEDPPSSKSPGSKKSRRLVLSNFLSKNFLFTK